MRENELYHSGVKGMKWGIRRYQNKDGTLTPAGKKRYGDDDSDGKYVTIRDASKKVRVDGLAARKAARENGRLSGIGAVRKGNKIQREAVKTSVKEKGEDKSNASKAKSGKHKERVAKTVAKGAEITSKLLLASAVDDIFYGGAGKKIAKEAVIQTGRAAVTAYTMARGGYDIKWYDKQGRRVG